MYENKSRFHLYHDTENKKFKVIINQLPHEDFGRYMCELYGKKESSPAKVKLGWLFAAIKNFNRSPTIGQNMTYWCQYPEGAPVKKFICKGEDPSICEHVVSAAQNTERFSMIDETEKRNITMTVRGVTKEDSGTYWCGAEHIHSLQGQYFYHRFLMTVVSLVPSPTSPASSPIQPATVSYHGFDRASVLEIALALSLDVMLLTLAVYLAYTGPSNCKPDSSHFLYHRTLMLSGTASTELPLFGLNPHN
ncbi:polymeric immunoglobulin receptor-like isoform X2 [Trematomus bernacchii]|uniref:polymeric immunoglobulin receptor-like isoform X2 n=1 Tax=Trematomus bernacchii TaxID=40690 RepID=UPI00146A4BE8|nr:polymeric immunoglobulin receptor-like isoform X2 [Trematomus bernacchii]XP_033991717.1 polymeric immunoglobulin receptor-like isoform X2 [Trematomus bernacchii]